LKASDRSGRLQAAPQNAASNPIEQKRDPSVANPKRHQSPRRRPIPPASTNPRKHKEYKRVIAPDGETRNVAYRPGRLNVDIKDVLDRCRNGTPDFSPNLLLAAYTLDWLRGLPANICVQACLHLKDAAAILGLEAVLTPVVVYVDEPNGLRSVYGTETPAWTGPEFSGHCILFLPDEHRVIDPTIRQIDGFQNLPYPYVGQLKYGDRNARALPPGTTSKVYVKNRQIEYHVAEGGQALLTDANAAKIAVTANPDLPAAIAAQTINSLRALGVAERLPTRHGRIRALLSTIGDAPLLQEGSQATFLIGGSPTPVDSILG
jgi:hypothetical protein